jgi:OOP family OmpA-OmpF porin
MYRRSRIPYFFLALAAILAISALVILLVGKRGGDHAADPPPTTAGREKAQMVEPAPIETLGEAPILESPEEVLADSGLSLAAVDPADVVNRIGAALESGDFAAVGQMIGSEALSPESLERLKQLAGGRPLRLREPEGVKEVGELELNALTRWSLELEGAETGRDRIFLDLRRTDGKWRVERLTLPPSAGGQPPGPLVGDPLGVADAFLQALLRQDFELARGFVDQQQVSDAKIAGLCILFEEGEYRLRPHKPLRTLFRRRDTAGFLTNVQTHEGSQSAQFSLTLRQIDATETWIVYELNLDQLLADYARRVAGGDLYYSPLVKNPQGGDTLALYFEFDEADINPRTERQLQIVAQILLTDPGKKLTLSGHTDSLGTKQYNNQLSARRAAVVRDFLTASGVSPEQIITLAKGASQPRRPNVTETGDDNPDGRRVNRRTEIYLDF